MVTLRIKQAQHALADGRLDEAFEQAQRPDVRAHREGQDLAGRLTPALLRRGEGHLAAGHLGEALADCEKAAQLAGNLPEVARLRAAIAEAAADRQRADRRVAQVAAAARDHLDQGRLSMGEQVLAAAEGAPGAQGERLDFLRRELAARRAEADKALDRAAAALERQEVGLAADELLRARRAAATNSRLAELTSRLMAAAPGRIGSLLEEGRLDLAESMLERVGPLADGAEDMKRYGRILGDCARACACVRSGRHREAAQILWRVSSTLPRAGWLSAAADRAEQAAEEIEAILSGPLGLVDGGDPDGAGAPVRDAAAAPPRMATPPPPLDTTALPMRFLVLVDGVGSYLVVRSERVTVGPVSSSARPDLGLVVDPNLPTIAIERVDEDYFVRADRGVCVNDRPTTSRLLANGDVIALSAGAARCRIRFGLPNPASTSAVLSLSGARLPRADVRQVVLLGRELIVGPGPSAHVRADALEAPAALHVRDGRLLCRSGAAVTVDGRPMDERLGIPMGAAVRIGPLSLTLAGA